MADWAHLPSDLLNLIGKHLTSQFDHLRFRSVCSTWRISLSPPPSPRLSILPNNGISDTSWGFYLSKRTVLSLSSPQFPSQSWLIKIEQDNPMITHLINPLTSSQFDLNLGFPKTLDSTQIGVSQSGSVYEIPTQTHFNGSQIDLNWGFPKTLDLMPIRVLELGSEYILRYINYRPFASSINDAGNLYMEKVALFFNPRIGYVLLTIHVSGKLAVFKIGDKKWTMVEKPPSPYDDVALFKERFYAVDNTGRTVVVNFDPSNAFSPVVELVANPVFGGDKKTMVVSGGDLLLIDTYLSVAPEDDMGFEEEVEYYEEFDCYMSERTVRFKVFRLDWGGKKWDEVHDLGDKMLFLGDYCTFSASASDFEGCKGNCIIFADRTFYSIREEEVGLVKGRGVGVFDLESGNIGFLDSYPGYTKMFWPPPSWVYSASSTLEDGLDRLGI